MEKLEIINGELQKIAEKYHVSISQIAIAYAISKGTLPIIGATKVKHVEEAKKASEIVLTKEEIEHLETTANKLNLNTIREWEKEMK